VHGIELSQSGKHEFVSVAVRAEPTHQSRVIHCAIQHNRGLFVLGVTVSLDVVPHRRELRVVQLNPAKHPLQLHGAASRLSGDASADTESDARADTGDDRYNINDNIDDINDNITDNDATATNDDDNHDTVNRTDNHDTNDN
jgi:hypothetical protein